MEQARRHGMAENDSVFFTIEFNQDGDIIRVKKQNGEVVPRESADNMAQIMANKTVCKSTLTEVLICETSSAGADPCVRHGNDLWCW
jgi:hypothetical protein